MLTQRRHLWRRTSVTVGGLRIEIWTQDFPNGEPRAATLDYSWQHNTANSLDMMFKQNLTKTFKQEEKRSLIQHCGFVFCTLCLLQIRSRYNFPTGKALPFVSTELATWLESACWLTPDWRITMLRCSLFTAYKYWSTTIGTTLRFRPGELFCPLWRKPFFRYVIILCPYQQVSTLNFVCISKYPQQKPSFVSVQSSIHCIHTKYCLYQQLSAASTPNFACVSQYP